MLVKYDFLVALFCCYIFQFTVTKEKFALHKYTQEHLVCYNGAVFLKKKIIGELFSR